MCFAPFDLPLFPGSSLKDEIPDLPICPKPRSNHLLDMATESSTVTTRETRKRQASTSLSDEILAKKQKVASLAQSPSSQSEQTNEHSSRLSGVTASSKNMTTGENVQNDAAKDAEFREGHEIDWKAKYEDLEIRANKMIKELGSQNKGLQTKPSTQETESEAKIGELQVRIMVLEDQLEQHTAKTKQQDDARAKQQFRRAEKLIKPGYDKKLQNADAKYKKQLEQKKTEFNRKYNEQLQAKQEKLDTVEENLKRSKAHHKEAERELKSQHKEDMKTMKVELQGKKVELQEREAELQKMQKELKTVQKTAVLKTLQKAQDDIDNLKNTINEKENEIVRLQVRVASLMVDRANLESQLGAVQGTIDQINRNHKAELEESNRSCNLQYSLAQQHRVECVNKQRAIRMLNDASERRIMEREELEKQLDAANTEIDRLRAVPSQATENGGVSSQDSSNDTDGAVVDQSAPIDSEVAIESSVKETEAVPDQDGKSQEEVSAQDHVEGGAGEDVEGGARENMELE